MGKIHKHDPRFIAVNRSKKSGFNAGTMQQDNRNLTLQLIRKAGAISRKQIAEQTGLQLATVTIMIKELLEQGVIRENGLIDGGQGRHVTAFSMIDDLYVIIVRLTAVYVKIALYDININPIYVHKEFFKTEDTIKEAIDIICLNVEKIETTVYKKKILSINIGVEHEYRIIGTDFAVWDKYRQCYCVIGKEIFDKTDYKVYVNRAINYSSYDLWDRYMEYRNEEIDYATIVCIQLSYDLEGAILVNRELLYGAEGTCGQIKDLRVDKESNRTYTDVVAVPALLKKAEALLEKYPDSVIAGKEKLNIRDVIAGYMQEDALCKKVYDEAAEYLGYLFAQIIEWFNPDAILIEDEIPASREYVDVLQKVAAQYCSEEKAKRIGTLLSKDFTRETKNDPALIGGAKYAFDFHITEVGLL